MWGGSARRPESLDHSFPGEISSGTALEFVGRVRPEWMETASVGHALASLGAVADAWFGRRCLPEPVVLTVQPGLDTLRARTWVVAKSCLF